MDHWVAEFGLMGPLSNDHALECVHRFRGSSRAFDLASRCGKTCEDSESPTVRARNDRSGRPETHQPEPLCALLGVITVSRSKPFGTSLCQSWWMCVLARFPSSSMLSICLSLFLPQIPTANSGTDNWHRGNCLLIEVFPLLIQHCFVHWCWQRFL